MSHKTSGNGCAEDNHDCGEGDHEDDEDDDDKNDDDNDKDTDKDDDDDDDDDCDTRKISLDKLKFEMN